MARLPHPIPYQGSKRLLAPVILDTVRGLRFQRLVEPFAGSAAITLAAAHRGLAQRFVIGESLQPLAALWNDVLLRPEALADRYAEIWSAQFTAGDGHYERVRDQFNEMQRPEHLLFLLARCVKNAPRFNQAGAFNQSPDRRRTGMHPHKMRGEILGAHELLAGRTEAVAGDFADTLGGATPNDLVYLDPPWQGTSSGPDKRYHQGLSKHRLEDVLADLNGRGVPFLLSYDGRSGEKRYGTALDPALGLHKLELHAGRSSQATLVGRTDETVESLYLSPALLALTDSPVLAASAPISPGRGGESASPVLPHYHQPRLQLQPADRIG